jgi:putative ABC transport system permease protein
MNASERWFRLLLRLYPADFRDEMGEALVETYLHRSREESVALVWFAALWDSLRNGLGERMRPAVAWRRTGDWGRDMELVGRRLRQRPWFVIAVLTTLTIGLGTFAVVYTAVDKILLEPLPYKDPSDLYMVLERARNGSNGGSTVLPGTVIANLQSVGGVIEGAAGMEFTSLTLPAGADRDAIRITALMASPNLFDLLGVRPVLGRGFRPNETGTDSPYVIVLSDALWKRFGGDPAIVGSEIKIEGLPFTVIGVMASNSRFSAAQSAAPDAYVPLYKNLAAEKPYIHDFRALVRARRGTPLELVRGAVEAVGRIDEREDNHQGIGRTLSPIGLQTQLVKSVRPALLALSFAVVFLVLVLTVNLASLLLARVAEREREFAVSRALGASGPAVVRSTLLEGGVLGLIGGVAGALVGIWGTRFLVALGPLNLPRRETIALDWGIALVVIGVGGVLGLLAAAAPATWAARVSLTSLISGIAVRGGAGTGRMRRSLIVVQVALSLVLVSTGGLVVRSFQQLLAASPGFRPEGVLTFNLDLGAWLFPEKAKMFSFQDSLEKALRALPSVTSVGATTTLPLANGSQVTTMTVPGATTNTGDPNHDQEVIDRIVIRPGYIETVGMRLIAGRGFENPYHPGVREAVIDQHLVRRFFPDRNPLGATIMCADVSMTVVGVVQQARLYDFNEDGRPQLFIRAEDYPGRRDSNYYVVHTDQDAIALVPEVRAAIRAVDRRVPVSEVKTLDQIVAERRSRERISAVMIASLAVGALILVSMGLFGVISGSVTRRRGELAVRMALGATHGRVIRLVVGEGARLVALGLLIGIPGIYMAGKALRGFLIVSPFDARTLAAVAIGLVCIALLVCYVAARRVTGIEPNRLLREGGQ